MADRKIRSDDAYTPGDMAASARTGRRPSMCQLPRGLAGRRADRARRHRGLLRRIAHYDYWSETVRRSIVVDSKCDILFPTATPSVRWSRSRNRLAQGAGRVHHRRARHCAFAPHAGAGLVRDRLDRGRPAGATSTRISTPI